jgi:4-hydroxy-3-methylbut-2-enyl diphosphate reductase
MEVVVADQAGFCFGVQRALRMAEKALEKRPRIASLGPLIHNRQVVERLAQRGLEVVNEVSEVDCGCALVRSHGAPPEVYEEAAARGIELLDATCPFVARAQSAAVALLDEDYEVVFLGEAHHPETVGIVARTGKRAHVVENPAEADELPLGKRVGVVAQTTQRLDRLQDLVARLLGRVEELKVHNTICKATASRQQAALALAERADVMIVVGGHHSANTSRLAELCRQTDAPTWHIETAAEIDPAWVAQARVVGVTAGASTPDEAIAEVCARLTALSETAPTS